MVSLAADFAFCIIALENAKLYFRWQPQTTNSAQKAKSCQQPQHCHDNKAGWHDTSSQNRTCIGLSNPDTDSKHQGLQYQGNMHRTIIGMRGKRSHLQILSCQYQQTEVAASRFRSLGKSPRTSGTVQLKSMCNSSITGSTKKVPQEQPRWLMVEESLFRDLVE